MGRRNLRAAGAILAGLALAFGFGPRAQAQTEIAPQSRTSGTVAPGGWVYYTVTIPENSPGWRLVLKADGAESPDLFIQKDENPTDGSYERASTGQAVDTLILRDDEITAGVWRVGVHLGEDASGPVNFQLGSSEGWVTELTWDPGNEESGTAAFSIPADDLGGLHYFRVQTENTRLGVWRQVLRVTGGEADLYLSRDWPSPPGSAWYARARPGSDGLTLPLSESSGAGETWYLVVDATPGAQWSVFAGDAHVIDLGALAADGSSGSAALPPAANAGTIPIEGVRFFRTSAPAETLAWRLWLQPASGDGTLAGRILTRESLLPQPWFDGSWADSTTQDQLDYGQGLLVTPTVKPGQGHFYYVAVPGEPGETFRLDSRQQPVTNLAFGATLPAENAEGAWYRTYRVSVPVDTIAWEVTARPETGDPSIAVRRALVGNARFNDAFSELASTTAGDSVTLVPPDLSDGTFFITTYGSAPHKFALSNGEPTITPIDYQSSTVNAGAAVNRNGWRYFSVTNIEQQLGFLGWLLELQNKAPGTQVAIRRNFVPSGWNYRDDFYLNSISRHDALGTGGFLQLPANPADIWYVGVYSPDASLGAFTLDSGPLTAQAVDVQVARSVTDLVPGRYQYFRIEVPAEVGGHAVKGWEVRMDSWSGPRPAMMIRRDALPDGTGDTPYWWGPAWSESWESGFQLGDAAGDWTKRNAGQAVHGMGMGQPLRPGTYYVGFYNSEWNAEATSFHFVSRLVGEAGSGLGYEIAPLAFAGGQAQGELGPREVKHFAVDVPEGAKNWRLGVDVDEGEEAKVYVRRAAMPNTAGWGYGTTRPWGEASGTQTILDKAGGERLLVLPDYAGEDSQTLYPGRYYVTIVGEGQNPASNDDVGDGEIHYTISSYGEQAAEALGTVPAEGTGALVKSDGYGAGEAKLYRFEVPAGLMAVEIKLGNRVGNPHMTLKIGEQQPSAAVNYGVTGGANWDAANTEIITVASPAPGIYTLAVGQSSNDGSEPGSGSYDLEIREKQPDPVAFNGGEQSVSELEPGYWKYFRIEVPAEVGGQPVVGWNLRLKEWSGARSAMAIRREALPNGTGEAPYWWGPEWSETWESGFQWGDAGSDWSGRGYPADGDWSRSPEQVVHGMGMGQPLEPGTYYVGFYNAEGNEPSTFTFVSEPVGTTGSGVAHELTELAYAGGTAEGELAARDVGYYAVDVPEGAKNWKLGVDVSGGGEVRVIVRRAALPNSKGWGYGTTRPWGDASGTQTVLDKAGNERLLVLPDYVDENSQTLYPGRYYVLVVSQGNDPVDAQSIGTGSVHYTIRSHGEQAAEALGTVPAEGTGTLVKSDGYGAGEAKLYRFEVPAGLMAVEIKLGNRVGNPHMMLKVGEQQPMAAVSYGLTGGANWDAANPEIITVPSPAPGIYTLVVGHSSNDGSEPGSGSYDLEIREKQPDLVTFNGGEQSVSELEPGYWKYFRIEVPAELGGQPVIGWNLRLKEWSGARPAMAIRRETLPNGTGEDPSWWGPQWSETWESGWQWGDGSSDWSGRDYPADGDWSRSPEQVVHGMGMDQPLEPGTYYVGFYNAEGNEPSTFTFVSEPVGTAGSGVAHELTELAYAGGMAEGELAARDVGYYAVDVPEGAKNWKLGVDVSGGGEVRVYVRRASLPNSKGWGYGTTKPWGDASGTQTVLDKAGGERLLVLPDYAGEDSQTLYPGRYYVLVASQGNDPGDAQSIGTGSVHYTLSSHGEQEAEALGTVPAEGTGTLVRSDGYGAGEAKLYRFEVPAGLMAVEIKLGNRVGNPHMTLKVGEQQPMAAVNYGVTGGANWNAESTEIITVPSPTPGTYTLTVAGDSNHEPAAGQYQLSVRAVPVVSFPFADGTTSGSVSSPDQRSYYAVEIPETLNGERVLGWQLNLQNASGQTEMRVRRGSVPAESGVYADGYEHQTWFARNALLVVPPVLTPGTWYVEVRGITAAEFTLGSRAITDSSLRREPWAMPLAGGASTTPGLSGATIGDTGISGGGAPLPGDQGVDLANGNFHLYAVDVPAGNGGLLRALLEAISGNPNVYLRRGDLPTLDHDRDGAAPWGSGLPLYEHQLQADANTEYGSWVPFDIRREKEIVPGRWYVMVRAAGNANSRYRLRLSHHASPLVQPLALNGGSFANQLLAAGDWRYYKVTMPATLGAMPASWTLTFTQSQGDVDLFIRAAAPPGVSRDPDLPPNYDETKHWQTDGRDFGEYGSFAETGSHVIAGRFLQPGQTYYLGFRANSDASFNVASAVSGTLGGEYGALRDLGGEGGKDSLTLAAGERVTWRVTLDELADRWRHFSTHAGDVQVFLQQGYLPSLAGDGNFWQSDGAADSADERGFNADRGTEFFLTAVNASGAPQPFALTVDWRKFALQIETEGQGYVEVSPYSWDERFDGSSVVTLTPQPGYPYALVRWEGDATGNASPLNVLMDGDKTIRAVFAVTFEAWIAGYGLPPEKSGRDDDPDHDGISNWNEFVFAGNPADASSGPLSTLDYGNPEAGVVLDYRTRKDISGVSVSVEASHDLHDWTPDDVQIVTEKVGEDSSADYWRATAHGLNREGYLRLRIVEP